MLGDARPWGAGTLRDTPGPFPLTRRGTQWDEESWRLATKPPQSWSRKTRSVSRQGQPLEGADPALKPALPSHGSSEHHHQPQRSRRCSFANTAWPGRRLQPVFCSRSAPPARLRSCFCCSPLAACSLLPRLMAREIYSRALCPPANNYSCTVR